jgi:NAD(P)H-dependent FMN reductase
MSNIVIVSGTNRPGSASLAVARRVADLYREADAAPSVLDLTELPIDAFRPESYRTKPVGLAPFTRAVFSADGLVFVVPEYNGGMPGALKYFIDLLPFPAALENKPVGFIGLAAGEWGGLRPVEQLQQVAIYRKALVYPRHTFIRSCEGLIRADVNHVDDGIVDRLRTQCRAFLRFVEAQAQAVSPA